MKNITATCTISPLKIQESYLMRINQIIVYGYICVQYLAAIGGKHCQIMIWELVDLSEIQDPQYILYTLV